MSWIKSAVIGLNLCPWAKSALREGLIDVRVSQATDVASLMDEVVGNIREMADSEGRETRIIVTESLLGNFEDYNKIANKIDKKIDQMECRGIIQLATFHPQYQFGDAEEDDVENWTNRSPYPMFHLLRENEIEDALDGYDDPDEVWQRNIKTVKEKGKCFMQQLLERSVKLV
ncbi:hypothetical protein GUITHDRAFT_114854 [Guillardia theta CCMP2712]|uniref:DUF1415 domain-containing protein n=1 Tax=Guillardia theta (strain CCMP2712) TaxID=905079 RepID=L1IST9_GUITC|nr:hypothetical protein GUITHDRAFT_114854 [Guillardia theta CCMP2712]EKX38974.1 hypothetical protein GUITHDRAFT_114854 [Guillardia theta CCMP2712]|eukprot:XP_005825954.1 hypothetical protein GUITHDRAFT_114854 [Guillardia theta CCMP2712]